MKGSKNLYDLLGLSTVATAKDIKKQFYRLSLLYHPDLAEDAVDAAWRKSRFLAIAEAYTVLQDPHRRREYDCTLQGQHPLFKWYRRNEHAKATGTSPETPDFMQDRSEFRPSAYRAAQDSQDRWARLSKQPRSLQQEEELRQMVRLNREEEARMLRNRLLVVGAGLLVYVLLIL